MNVYGGGLIAILIYGQGEIASGTGVILTEAGDDLLTEASDTLITETV